MRPQTVAWHLPELMAPDAILCGDSGTVTVWQARMKLREWQRFSFSGTMCSMAAALPYADRRTGRVPEPPGRRVHRRRLADDDDGRLRNPGAAQVAGEGGLDQERHARPDQVGADAVSNPEYGVDLAPVDFVKFAEACGARGLRIDDPKNCREQLRQGLAMDGPLLIPRRVSGYNLDDLLPEKGFRVARSLVGSEGTCALTLAATVRLVHCPAKRALLVLGYPAICSAQSAETAGEFAAEPAKISGRCRKRKKSFSATGKFGGENAVGRD